MTGAVIQVGDCIERMRELAEASVDAIVTDPPYGLEFMGKDWDRLSGQPGYNERGRITDRPDAQVPYGRGGGVNSYQAGTPMQEWHEVWAREALRVLKPGGHLLAFGGTRTFHRLAVAIEDAGFEIRDCLMWLYGSGFPKSLNVGKAIDKAARGVPQGGADPTSANHGRYKTQATEGKRGESDVGRGYGAGPGQFMRREGEDLTAYRERVAEPLSADAERWEGWGTALKPGWEPIVVARKPLVGTVAGNVLEHGTGALNIDACRVETSDNLNGGTYSEGGNKSGLPGDERDTKGAGMFAEGEGRIPGGFEQPPGRWPANVVLSHSEDCVLVGERQVPRNIIASHAEDSPGKNTYGSGGPGGGSHLEATISETVERWACVPGCPVRLLDDQAGESTSTGGSASLGAFRNGEIYGAGRDERWKADPGYGDKGGPSRFFYCAKAGRAERNAGLDGERNAHPTVKPIDLMRWLVRLVTPPGGLVLDPFAGSGSTGAAAALEGFRFMGIERDAEYVAIAEARIRFWAEHPTGLPVEAALEADARRRKVRESGQMELG